MPQYNVSLKSGADEAKLKEAKDKATSSGGKITHEMTLIKGFTVEYPEGHMDTLSSNEDINVESDGNVSTQ